jgi:hypothetical protein
MMTWNPKYTAGIWIGNHSRNIPFNTSPENITDPIMKSFMQGAIDNLGSVKAQQFVAPSDIKTASAFVNTHKYIGQQVPSSSTDIFPSWYVGKVTNGSAAATDKVSGKLATSCTPSMARQSSGGGSLSALNVDLFVGGTPNTTTPASSTSSGTKASDDVHSCSDQTPSADITAVTPLNGSPSGNGNSGTNCANGCTVMVVVQQGTHPLNDSNYPNFPGTLNLLVNGQSVQSQQIDSSGDYTFTYTPASGSTGTAQLEVQVVDSVLYSGTSDAQTVSLSGASQTGSH